MYPNFVVEDTTTGETVLVGDTKCKTDPVDISDIYQMTAYVSAHHARGTFVNQAQEGHVQTEYTIGSKWPLSVVELPTSAETASPEKFVSELTDNIEATIKNVA